VSKTILFVSHCYAMEHGHFARAMMLQAASLASYEGPHQIIYGLCYSSNDWITTNKMTEIISWPPSIELLLSPMPVKMLGKRCNGRNLLAKITSADVVWFTDVDHLFTAECVNALLAMDWPGDVSLRYPGLIQISRDHETGDRTMNQHAASFPHTFKIDSGDYVDKKYNRAIGGVQIVSGQYAREHGYLDGTSWIGPCEKPFRSFKDDIAFRDRCKQHGRAERIDLPGIYRVRHLTTSYQ